jgi:DNA-binding NarL/FixJ family response regulator
MDIRDTTEWDTERPLRTGPTSPYMHTRLRALAPRQRVVLELIGRGYSTPEIAQELGIKQDVARLHVTRVIAFVKSRGHLEKGEEASLTRRQEDVLQLMRKGMTDREIAVQLGLGRRTVETHAGQVLRKMHVASRTELVER